MRSSLGAMVLLLLALAATASAADLWWAKRVLAWQKVHATDRAAREFAAAALRDPRTVRFAVNARQDYVIATPDGVLANGSFHAADLGRDVKVSITSGGDWLAAGTRAAFYDGTLFTEPARVASLHRDLGTFAASDFRPAGAASEAAAKRPAAKPGVVAKAPGDGNSPQVNVVIDHTPPTVTRLEIITKPNDPAGSQTGYPPQYVGAYEVHLRVLMSEKTKAAPQLTVTQLNRPARPAALLKDANPLYTYQFFPDTSPDANGPASLAITGQDLAGNPVADGDPAATVGRALIVDTVPPDLRRVDVSVPGNFRTVPKEGAVIAGSAFPKVIQAFLFDYDQPDDGTFQGQNVATAFASGVDWDALRLNDGSLSIKLFAPGGKEIHGTMTARIPALELLLPDVYDPGLGIFPDGDSDGRADPTEGTYRIEIAMVDKAGNKTGETLSYGMDVTPIPVTHVNVSLKPILSEPFPNPPDPIPATGTAVKRLDAVEVTSDDAEFDFLRSNAKLLFYGAGRHFYPTTVKTALVREPKKLILQVLRDQDGDGQDDFENPAPGQYLPPGMVDPRWGRNDGPYVVEVTALDTAGNSNAVTRDLVLDTTAPQVGHTFPAQDVTLGGPLRMVDALIKDPRATSGAEGAGIELERSLIRLLFEGNQQTEAQPVNGVGFVHEPNSTDPTQPDFNPEDVYPKLLFEITDESGHVTALPQDGSWDGKYRIELSAYDRAGNQVTASAGFTYSSTAPATPTTGAMMTLMFP